MALPQLFGIVPTGQPVVTAPTSAPAETSFIYNLPPRPFSHIVVFLLPGIALPPDTAAAVYLSTPSNAYQNANGASAPEFKFLGGIGPGKESAIFKINGLGSGGDPGFGNASNIDMDAPEGQARQTIIGISIEPAASVASQMANLSANKSQAQASTNDPNHNGALVLANRQQTQRPDTVMLAQRIIKNAFNFLASFSGNVPVPGGSGIQGVEVVPLKAFEDWWKKFEGKVRSDPGFLEREDD